MDTHPLQHNKTTHTLASPLLEFDFDVIHHAETKHQAAEALSRLSTTGKDGSLRSGKLLVLAIDPVVNANTSDTTDNGNDHHVVNLNNSAASTDEPIYALSTLFKLIFWQ